MIVTDDDVIMEVMTIHVIMITVMMTDNSDKVDSNGRGEYGDDDCDDD